MFGPNLCGPTSLHSPSLLQASSGSRDLLLSPDAEMKHSSSSLLSECHQSLSQLHKAMQQIDTAGACLSNCLRQALDSTVYKCVGDALQSKLADVYSFANSTASCDIFSEMDGMLKSLQAHENWHQDPQIYGQVGMNRNIVIRVSFNYIK